MQTSHFRDFDAFASSVRDVDCKMMLQNPRHRIWSLNAVDLDGIDVQVGRLGSGNILEGQSSANGYLVYAPLTNECEYTANGTVLPRNSFMILEPGCEFCLTTRFEHDWCSVFVPTARFGRGGDLATPSPDSERMTRRVTRPNRQTANSFRAAVGRIMTTAASCSQFEAASAATCAAAELLKIVSPVVGQQGAGVTNREGRPRLPREEIIRRSMELLEERDGVPILVGELAAAADVSERTLQTTFNEYFGVGPVRYLQLRQLHRIRHALRAADPKAVSVGDVLVRYGEWQFGRFASRYRRLFGERPSETLRTKGNVDDLHKRMSACILTRSAQS
jgi:AraC family ethanolamine operon transcriptional activator